MDPKELLNNPDNVKLLINLLQSLLPQTDQPTSQADKPGHKQNKKTKIRTKSRKRQSEDNDFENRFTHMPEFSMHKEDASIDKKLSKHPPVARMREFELVEATCRVCGKTEEISPALLFEGAARYKCNNCSTNAG